MVACVSGDQHVLTSDWLLYLEAPLQILRREYVLPDRVVRRRGEAPHRLQRIIELRECIAIRKSRAEDAGRGSRDSRRRVRIRGRSDQGAVENVRHVRVRRVGEYI